MAKTVSAAELGHGAASRAISDAQEEPVLVTKDNRPAAWIFSAEKLAQVAAARGAESSETYERALELLAVELYREGTLSLGLGAMLAGMSLHDFIDLCSSLHVPTLWEPPGGLAAEVDGLERFLQQHGASD